MQRIAPVFLSLFLFCVELPVAAQAGPREELAQLVAQLQSNPSDIGLRERIIKLGLTIKPPPAIPDEARRRMARGIAAFQGAKSQSDYRLAVQEFQAATNAAPWFGDAYYNLGVAQDKAEDYAAAIQSLKFALLANPGSEDTKSLLYQVEFRQEQANSPAAQAAKKREQDAALIRSLDGARFVNEFIDSFGVRHRSTLEIHGTLLLNKFWDSKEGEFWRIDRCTLVGLRCEYYRTSNSYGVAEISPDGQRATTTLHDIKSGRDIQRLVHQRQ